MDGTTSIPDISMSRIEKLFSTRRELPLSRLNGVFYDRSNHPSRYFTHCDGFGICGITGLGMFCPRKFGSIQEIEIFLDEYQHYADIYAWKLEEMDEVGPDLEFTGKQIYLFYYCARAVF